MDGVRLPQLGVPRFAMTGGVRPDREIHDIFDLRQAGCLRNDEALGDDGA